VRDEYSAFAGRRIRYREPTRRRDAGDNDTAQEKAPHMNEDPGAASPLLGIVFTVIALAILLAA